MQCSHANRGRRWEDKLNAWHAVYRRQGRAYIARTPPPVKLLSSPDRGRFMACFSSSGPPDYAAIVDGRAVVFDAKRTAKSRLAYSAIADHQAAQLDEVAAAGGLAWLAVSSATGDWCVWWAEATKAWQRWRLHGGRPASLILEAGPACAPMDSTGWLRPVQARLVYISKSTASIDRSFTS